MSTFFLESITCPHCGDERERRVAHSVNGQRAPHLREQILHGSFQHVVCEDCGEPFVINEPFVYVDLPRRQWVHVYATEQEAEWRLMEAETREALELAGGPSALPASQLMMQGVQARTVFGLDGLREKLLCSEAGLDDARLELLKLELGTAPGGIPLSTSYHLRLQACADDELVLVAGGVDEAIVVQIVLPRAGYDELGAAPERWQGLYQQLVAGTYVDLGRFLIPGAADAKVAPQF